ncbi:MAG: Ppx/GppA phosphatase family protein [Actinomycetota bacterium]|nr:Ppx/GppA phosphatase family protein [Actinomycetota bacterium]
MAEETRRLAAIDIGTVTVRLLVADVSRDAIVEVERSTDITHVGEGLTVTGRLSDEAMDRVADVMARYAARMGELGVEAHRAIATSASRDAANGEEFLGRLEAAGVRPEIVSGDREASLSFEGAAYSFPGKGLLVVDVGGGSTELILGDSRVRGGVRSAQVEQARSVDVGSRRLTEMFLRSDPPAPAELDEAWAYAVSEIRPFFDAARERASAMISLAGTATTLSAIQMGLAEYDSALVHGSMLAGSDLSEMVDMLSSLPLAERMQVPGLHPGRAPVIVAGTIILATALSLAGLDSTRVSEHDILYGILLDTFGQRQ